MVAIKNRSAFADVRRILENKFRQSSLLRASLVLFPTVAIYLLLVGILFVSPWWLMPVLGLAVGVVGAIMFVVGHDAAHNSFTSNSALNGILARLCFIPAWHAYSGWVHGHNHIHHGWTNLTTKDYVWAPMSKAQYDALSEFGKWCVRFYRSAMGFAAYYMLEINLRKIFFLQPEVRSAKVRWLWLVDDALLLLGMAVHGLAIYWLARNIAPSMNPYWVLINAMVVPAIMTNYLIGFLTYLQHTHPQIPWFNDQTEWTYYIGAVRGTTHTHFPYPINSTIHNIMEHTAHHADPRIPLYNLPAAQRQIEATYPGDVVQHRFTFHSLSRTIKTCQLYDFVNHCWLSYDGEPTSSRTVQIAFPHGHMLSSSNSRDSEST